MPDTNKISTKLDANQVIRSVFNPSDSSLSTAGFLVGVMGRKITIALSTTSVTNDTQIFTFTENGLSLYTLKLIYTDATQNQLLSAERIA